MNEVLPKMLRWWGLIPLSLFLVRFIEYVFILRTPVHILWSCHIANLFLAVGLFFLNKPLIRVTSYLLIMGVLPWLIDVIVYGEVNFTSILSHLAGGVVAGRLLQMVGVIKWDWCFALAFFLLLQQFTRLVTEAGPYTNINLAHYAYGSLSDRFNNYFEYWVFSTIVTGFMTWTIESFALHFEPSQVR